MTKPGDLLRTAREAAGISQKQLADRLGTQQSAISRIEQGRVSPTVSTLERYMRAAEADLILLYRPVPIGDQHAPSES